MLVQRIVEIEASVGHLPKSLTPFSGLKPSSRMRLPALKGFREVAPYLAVFVVSNSWLCTCDCSCNRARNSGVCSQNTFQLKLLSMVIVLKTST